MDKENVISLLGEGFHTAFRKIVQTNEGHKIWELIQKLDHDDWIAVLEFVYEGIKGQTIE